MFALASTIVAVGLAASLPPAALVGEVARPAAVGLQSQSETRREPVDINTATAEDLQKIPGIGEALARQQRAGALVTGESLGQVSSQTLKNIATIDDIATMPVLRPLIGMNKQEIVQMAQNIDTYPVSILSDQDCCTLFIPRHPVIYSDQKTVTRLEALLPVDSMVQKALEQVELKEYSFPEPGE